MAETRWLDERELAAWQGFLAVSAILNRRVEQQLKDVAGLSHPQYEVLARLSAAPGGALRMTELAGVALTSKSGLTYQVAQLEKAGLVRREACASDDRVWSPFSPTTAGANSGKPRRDMPPWSASCSGTA